MFRAYRVEGLGFRAHRVYRVQYKPASRACSGAEFEQARAVRTAT